MRLVAGLAALLALNATGGHSAARPCGTAVPPERWGHVVWIWMENASYDGIVGNQSARYLNQLAREWGLATNYSAISHPSLPNYLAATSGSDWGIADDNPPAAHPIPHASIFSQVAAADMTWRSYDEDMPSRCDVGECGRVRREARPGRLLHGYPACLREVGRAAV